MKAGDKVTIGRTTFIILKMVQLKENTTQYNDECEYIRKGEVYPVILESDVDGEYINFLIINREQGKQYFNSDIFDEVI